MLKPGEIRKQVGGRKYSRAVDYVRSGRVVLRDVADGFARAAVSGTEAYVATASFSGPELKGSCTCPASDRKFVCKHVVATALAAMDDPKIRRDGGSISAWLNSLPHGHLKEMIVELAFADRRLFRSLLIAAAAQMDNRQIIASAAATLTDEAETLLENGEDGSDEAAGQALEVVKLLLAGGQFELAAACAYRLSARLPPPDDLPEEDLLDEDEMDWRQEDWFDDSQPIHTSDEAERLYREACERLKTKPLPVVREPW